MIKEDLLCFSMCPLPPVLSLGTTWKILAPLSLFPPYQVCDKILSSLLISRLNSPSCSWSQFSQPILIQKMLQSHQNTQVLLCRTSFQLLSAGPVLLSGVTPPQGQDFLLIELHEVHLCPFVQLGQVPLDGRTSIRVSATPSQDPSHHPQEW